MWRLLEWIDSFFDGKPSTNKGNMTSTMINLVVLLIEEIIKLEPALAAEFETLFSGKVPTAADFAALRAKIAGESYEALVPASQLNDPAPTPAPATPPAPPTPPPDAASPKIDPAVGPIVQH